MIQFIYIVYLQLTHEAECELRASSSCYASVGLVLCRGTTDAAVIRCGWRARGDVTLHAVTASVGRVARLEFICSMRAALTPHYRPASSSRIDETTISSVSFFSQAVFFFLELSSSVSSGLFFSYRYSYSYSIGT